MATADVSGASLGLIRASGAEFFAHPWSGARARRPPTSAASPIASATSRWLHQRQVRAVIDLRPIPPELRIVEPETVLCTTIGRLRDYWDLVGAADIATAEPERVVREAFWRLAPVRAIVCYAGRAGTIVCRRGGHATESVLQRIEMVWPPDPHGNLGMVTGGDAFVAGLIDGLLDQPDDPVGAACRAHTALLASLTLPLGHPVNPLHVREAVAAKGAVRPGEPAVVNNPRLSLLGRVLDRIGRAQDELMTVPGLITPEGGALATALDTLGRALDRWAPEKGKDLIAVFGESRSGKEYALARLLRLQGVHLRRPGQHAPVPPGDGVNHRSAQGSGGPGRPPSSREAGPADRRDPARRHGPPPAEPHGREVLLLVSPRRSPSASRSIRSSC